MNYEFYSHRFADIILNADYDLKREIDDVVRMIKFDSVIERFTVENQNRKKLDKKLSQGKQSIINQFFREEFKKRGWEVEKNIFNDPENDLTLDFWKRSIGVDVAFNHRSFTGGDLLRLQAAAEIKNVIKVGVYICPFKSFAKVVSPKDASSMVNYERTIWYLENFYPLFTLPIFLIGLRG
jgi:hypothetical protein